MTEISIKTNGGKRTGAGRKEGTGKFGEPTSVLRIPASQTSVIKDFLVAYQRKKVVSAIDALTEFALPALNTPVIKLPLYTSKVSAGFPSPAEEHMEMRLDPSECTPSINALNTAFTQNYLQALLKPEKPLKAVIFEYIEVFYRFAGYS